MAVQGKSTKVYIYKANISHCRAIRLEQRSGHKMAEYWAIDTMMMYLSRCLLLGLIWALVKFFHKVWWTPLRIQLAMNSQGVKGPPYRFFYGSIKEMGQLRKESMKNPVEVHQASDRVQPHIFLWSKLYGKNFLLWKGTIPQFVVTEPELVKEVLNCKVKPEMSHPYLKKLFGDGLVVTSGEKWFKHRKLANHAFHGESLKDMIPAMVASTEMMIERWNKLVGTEIEVYQEFKVLTSEVISRTAFGSSYLEGQRVFDMLTRLILLFSRNAYKVKVPVISKIFKSQDDIESDKLEQGIRDCIIQIIKKREEAAMMGQMDKIENDFLGQLLKVYGDPDERNRMTINDLIDDCKNFYVAGQETTTSTLCWTILLLAVHTEWQEKVRLEVLELFGHQIPTAEGISKLKIMSMVVNESLRLYTPIGGTLREVPKGARLGSVTVPSTMEIQVPPPALHHDPEIWGDDEHLFKPERFADGVAKATNNITAGFIPFGLGPRHCVGMNFALNEIKIVLSMILQRYKFTLSPSYVHSPTAHLGLIPEHGLQVMLQAA